MKTFVGNKSQSLMLLVLVLSVLAAIGGLQSVPVSASQTMVNPGPAAYLKAPPVVVDIYILKINGENYNPADIGMQYSSPITVEGIVTATDYIGNAGQYHVEVNWGDGSAIDRNVITTFAATATGFSGAWSANHLYTVVGDYSIVVTVYHAQPGGVEQQSATISIGHVYIKAVATKLSFNVEPSGGLVGTIFPAQPQVTVQNAGGQTVTDFYGKVDLTIGSGTAGAALLGATQVEVSNGVAVFNNLYIDKAGSYTLIASSAGLTGADSNSFNVAPSSAAITLDAETLNATYDGSLKTVSATTVPAGLAYSINYRKEGVDVSPVNAGSYDVTATIMDPNYFGYASGTLNVSKAEAAITLDAGTLSAVYGAAAKSAAATTPEGLTVYFSYNGSDSAPADAGSYALTATVVDENYTGSTSGTMVIAQASPVITWANPASIFAGTALSGAQLNATASVPGNFLYTPALGTVLSAGNQTLSAIFTPADSLNYAVTGKSVSLSVQVYVYVAPNPEPPMMPVVPPVVTPVVNPAVTPVETPVVDSGETPNTTPGTTPTDGPIAAPVTGPNTPSEVNPVSAPETAPADEGTPAPTSTSVEIMGTGEAPAEIPWAVPALADEPTPTASFVEVMGTGETAVTTPSAEPSETSGAQQPVKVAGNGLNLWWLLLIVFTFTLLWFFFKLVRGKRKNEEDK